MVRWQRREIREKMRSKREGPGEGQMQPMSFHLKTLVPSQQNRTQVLSNLNDISWESSLATTLLQLRTQGWSHIHSQAGKHSNVTINRRNTFVKTEFTVNICSNPPRCHKKIPQTRYVKQQKMSCLLFYRVKGCHSGPIQALRRSFSCPPERHNFT